VGYSGEVDLSFESVSFQDGGYHEIAAEHELVDDVEGVCIGLELKDQGSHQG
jgi:hypothetical protein